MQALAEKYSGMPLKLFVDGKKISRGKGKLIGDIDCWGYESSPTLEEKRFEHQRQIDHLKSLQIKIDSLVKNDTISLQMLKASKMELLQEIKYDIKVLAEKKKKVAKRKKYIFRAN